MNPVTTAAVVFACSFAGALGGIGLAAVLPKHHLSSASKDTVKLGTGLIATMTALVLGLVTASAKGTFDDLSKTIRHNAAGILSLDRALARYGPETAEIRTDLKAAIAARVEAVWSLGRTGTLVSNAPAAAEVELLPVRLRGLVPQSEDQRWLKERALQISESLMEARWLVFTSLGSSIPLPFLAMLLFWLALTFASFGLFAPRNATVLAVLFLCALSVAGALFLVVEMDGPFDGLITVSPDPLRFALAQMNR